MTKDLDRQMLDPRAPLTPLKKMTGFLGEFKVTTDLDRQTLGKKKLELAAIRSVLHDCLVTFCGCSRFWGSGVIQNQRFAAVPLCVPSAVLWFDDAAPAAESY